MERLTSEQLGAVIAENADLSCRIVTDELHQYRPIGKMFAGGHDFVKHSGGEYVRPGTDIHTNCVEGVFSLLRRGVMGTFHSVSRKHLPNYLNEFEFRVNTRTIDDGERVTKAILRSEGKLLKYRESVECPPYAISTST